MRPWLSIVLAAAATACATLPDSQPLPHGQEAAHAVTEMRPGHWHVMVRVNYYAPETEAERLLRERAAALCPGEDAVLEDLRLVSQPHQASAEVHCRPVQDARAGATSTGAGVAAASPASGDAGPVHPRAAATPERAMVRSGPGVAACRPEPGYLPAFAAVAADRREGDARPVAAAETAVADGWIPATGDAPATAGVAVAVEEIAAPQREEEPARPFWPTVRDTYEGLVAEVE
jgi:hypothetical protein